MIVSKNESQTMSVEGHRIVADRVSEQNRYMSTGTDCGGDVLEDRPPNRDACPSFLA